MEPTQILKQEIEHLSHDLVAPLRIGRQLLQLLEKGDFGELSSEALDIIRTLQGSHTRLLEMVQNLLPVGPITSNTQREVDLDSMLVSVAREYRILVPDEVRFSVDLRMTEQFVLGNNSALYRVFANLLGNAFEFTQSGKIEIRSQCHGTWAIVEIEDTGCGMDEPTQKRVFKRLETGDCPGSGTGLGLYLCQQIVESHGGTISCRSVPGRGTNFTVRLPLSANPVPGRLRPCFAPVQEKV